MTGPRAWLNAKVSAEVSTAGNKKSEYEASLSKNVDIADTVFLHLLLKSNR